MIFDGTLILPMFLLQKSVKIVMMNQRNSDEKTAILQHKFNSKTGIYFSVLLLNLLTKNFTIEVPSSTAPIRGPNLPNSLII